MKHCTVLIADDNAHARAGLRALLALRPDIQVVSEATNGLEVVEMVRDCRPDAILMDVRMPLMDGMEATRRIKALYPEARIVVVSMYGSHWADALAAGADAFLLKGCLPEELFAAILGRGE